MAKEISFGLEAITHLQNGVKKLSNLVKSTLGPKGKNIVLERKFATPLVTNDGVTIAKEIELKNKFENIGANLIKEVSIKTNDVAGDGTTTACVLAESIILDGFKNYVAGSNPVILKNGIKKATEICVDQLKQISKPIFNSTEIFQVASISAADEEIGKLIMQAFEKIGKDGVITVEDGKSLQTELKFVEGMQFDRGYLSPYMITNPETLEANLSNCYILICQNKISSINELLPILEFVNSKNKPLLIITDEIENDVLATIVVNKLRGNLNCVVVKSPAYADRRKGIMADIAALTNATVITEEMGLTLSEASADVLGEAKNVKVTKDSCLISGGCGLKENIDNQIALIKAQILKSESDFDKEKLTERLAKLTGGIAVICVGSTTEVEMQEKKLRIEDAIAATKSAVEEGIVVGGGVALVKCANALQQHINTINGDEKIGAQIVYNALFAPIKQIAENAGVNGGVIIDKILSNNDVNFGYDALNDCYVNMFEAGIIDPTKVTRTALINAASVAGTMLTTTGIVCEEDLNTNAK